MERLTDEIGLKACDNCKKCEHLCDAAEKALEKLADYEDAEENGLLVRLPCRVGDKLYHINGKFILEFTIYSFNADESGAWLIHAEHCSEETDRTFSRCFETDAIGKTVFLTQEEAEGKLKEMEGENAD